ncbi:MAG: YbaB/EbfC family nucleoid-associated protein [Clostridia bacterium]|jgi:DNA-binding YbaB/EbfC family protein|nr:YbaB/EbfC family nucleoid-associated protein [Clostridia bacterium]
MNPFELLKNSQAIKEQSEKLQAELAELTAEGSSGGRMVNIKINGKFELQEITLDPICVDNRDVKMLEDLIIAAHNNAMQNIQEKIKEKSASLLGGLNLGNFGL